MSGSEGKRDQHRDEVLPTGSIYSSCKGLLSARVFFPCRQPAPISSMQRPHHLYNGDTHPPPLFDLLLGTWGKESRYHWCVTTLRHGGSRVEPRFILRRFHLRLSRVLSASARSCGSGTAGELALSSRLHLPTTSRFIPIIRRHLWRQGQLPRVLCWLHPDLFSGLA